MANLLQMGGYGAYVWSAYIVFILALVGFAGLSWWQARRVL